MADDRVVGTNLTTGEKIRLSDLDSDYGKGVTFSDNPFWKSSEEWKERDRREKPLTELVNRLKKEKEKKMTMKLVQYYVVDPDPQLPDDMQILDQGVAVIRDETEFKVGLDLPGLLEHHNKNRTTIEYEMRNSVGEVLAVKTLKAAKIRNLRIIINTVEEWC